jgi:hypothetical protein
MTPDLLYSSARMAMKLARECELSSLDFDNAWHDYMISEARRHRDRAAHYLRSRRWMLNDEVHNEQH